MLPNRQVVHEGQHYLGGEELDVPGQVAVEWARFGWAQLIEHRLVRRRKPRPEQPVKDAGFATGG